MSTNFIYTAPKLTLGLALAGLGTFAIFSAPGCTVTVGPGDDTDAGCDPQFTVCDTADTSTPDIDSSPSNPCNECLRPLCEAQIATCQNDSSCESIRLCASAPACAMDQNCVNNCYAAGTQQAQNEYLSLANCDAVNECGSCQSTCTPAASLCQGTDGGETNACDACTSTSCSSQKTACAVGSDCDDYSQCIAVCTGSDSAQCIDACGQAHPTGKAASEAYSTCLSANCSAQCQ